VQLFSIPLPAPSAGVVVHLQLNERQLLTFVDEIQVDVVYYIMIMILRSSPLLQNAASIAIYSSEASQKNSKRSRDQRPLGSQPM
jgi:hypothetical protein